MHRPIYDHADCAAPWATVSARFAADPTTWLPIPAIRVPNGIVVGMSAPGLKVTVDALVVIGAHTIEGAGLRVRPIAWRARHADRLFPRMVADLELSMTCPTICRLTLLGGYQPPNSVAGDAADRLVGRRVAAAVVREFLRAVGRRLSAPTGAAAPTS